MIDIIFLLVGILHDERLADSCSKGVILYNYHKLLGASAPAPITSCSTHLDAEGHTIDSKQSMSIDDAEAMVKQEFQENPDTSVILQADKRAAHGQVSSDYGYVKTI